MTEQGVRIHHFERHSWFETRSVGSGTVDDCRNGCHFCRRKDEQGRYWFVGPGLQTWQLEEPPCEFREEDRVVKTSDVCHPYLRQVADRALREKGGEE